jgi:hypothetical protein
MKNKQKEWHLATKPLNITTINKASPYTSESSDA